MSDEESRHGHLPTEGGGIFAENGSKTVENDQTGLPPWAAALTAWLQTTLAAQLTAQAKAHREELQELVAECRASVYTCSPLYPHLDPEQPKNLGRS